MKKRHRTGAGKKEQVHGYLSLKEAARGSVTTVWEGSGPCLWQTPQEVTSSRTPVSTEPSERPCTRRSARRTELPSPPRQRMRWHRGPRWPGRRRRPKRRPTSLPGTSYGWSHGEKRSGRRRTTGRCLTPEVAGPLCYTTLAPPVPSLVTVPARVRCGLRRSWANRLKSTRATPSVWYSTMKSIPQGEGSTASVGEVGSRLERTQAGHSNRTERDKTRNGLLAGVDVPPPSPPFVH